MISLPSIRPRVDASPRFIALVVEDEPSVRDLIIEALAHVGVLGHGVGSGEAAVAWLDAHRAPDLVSLDLVLPWMGGLRVCEHLRGHVRTAHVPIVVLTGRTEMQDEAAALEAGADAFVEKPFKIRDYLEQVRCLLPPGPALEVPAAPI